ncbi:sugar phosphate isomerase/epimerase family protein [Scatolibacter rhodanostii]|uniref:sugar phosphate isomerase/epimerase family protein n=1 Tax=Scatolibacter rhodanostii TaxID=2014781 RepID=UPI000C06B5D2|nr:sugar phosphate isomerase/epimerase family protein [Scatolibacter rhodanostii]
MKYSVSTYSFSSLLGSGEMTQKDCIKKAKEMGFDAIEFVGVQPESGFSEEEYADILKAECEKEGLFVSNYTVGADFLTGSGGDLQKEIARVCKEVDMAVRLGATSMRHDATAGYPQGERGFKGFDQVLPILVEGCRAVTAYAKTKGVRTMVENHGYFSQDSRRVEKLVNAVADDNFGLLCDMGNFLCVDEAPEKAYARVAPYAFYAHAKDFLFKSGQEGNPGQGFFPTRAGNYLRGTIIGHGVVPVKQCLQVLKSTGYDGTIAIEFEGLEPALSGIALGLENLKRLNGDI